MFQEIYYKLAELKRILSTSILYAEVKDVDRAKGRIKVVVDEATSDWIPITRLFRSSYLPNIGTQGLIVAVGGELNQSIWLGTIHKISEAVDMPPDVFRLTDDVTVSIEKNSKGDVVTLDIKGGSLVVNNDGGNIKLKTKELEIEATSLKINGDVDVKGEINLNSVPMSSHIHTTPSGPSDGPIINPVPL